MRCVTTIWKQEGQVFGPGWKVSYRLRAGRSQKDETVWMFDNEIDWVIAHRALVYRTGGREAAGGRLQR